MSDLGDQNLSLDKQGLRGVGGLAQERESALQRSQKVERVGPPGCSRSRGEGREMVQAEVKWLYLGFRGRAKERKDCRE